MNKKFKMKLKAVFDAPEPERKNEFVSSLNYPVETRFGFIISQIGFIRKRVWVVSCLLVAAVIFWLRFNGNGNILNFVWVISSVVPFVSLLCITEAARSTSYNMAELEMSCRYNLSGVILARLSILGIFNATVFGLIITLLSEKVGFGTINLGIYLLAPFLLTCLLSLAVLNRLRSIEAIYICGGVSCFVSIANALFKNQYQKVFIDRHLFFSGAVFFIMVICMVAETYKFISKTEEIQWSL